MSDLNTLVPANSPLFLLFATGINSSGEIAGFGAVKSTCMGDPSLCEVHAFLASPDNGATGRASVEEEVEGAAVFPEEVRKALRERVSAGQVGVRRTGK